MHLVLQKHSCNIGKNFKFDFSATFKHKKRKKLIMPYFARLMIDLEVLMADV